MMSVERGFGTRAGHVQYIWDCPASFGRVGNYALLSEILKVILMYVRLVQKEKGKERKGERERERGRGVTHSFHHEQQWKQNFFH